MRKLKSLTAFAVAAALVAASCPLSFADDGATVLRSLADVTAVEDGSLIRVKTKDSQPQEIDLRVNADTVIIDNGTKKAVNLDELSTGDEIMAYYSAAMTRSIPPQSNCFAIVTGMKQGDATANYLIVDEIKNVTDGSMFFADDTDSYLITVTPDTEVSVLGGESGLTPGDIEEGDILFAWYMIIGLSHPAVATAESIVIIGKSTDAGEPEPETPALPLIARPTAAAVLVNGVNVAFDAYNIDGNNYFKLRDLAFKLSGSDKQFEAGYDDEENAISLTSGKPYTEIGGEMAGKGDVNKTPVPTRQRIFLDGDEVAFTAYNIDGNNYFKLRDIGEAFDFGVDWDEESKTVSIDTSKGYEN